MATFPGFLFCCLVHQALKPALVPRPPYPFWVLPYCSPCQGHKGPPLLGVLLCCLAHQALKWPNWLHPSLIFRVSHLQGPLAGGPSLFLGTSATY